MKRDLTPDEIKQMREEIARMLCARNARFKAFPDEDPLRISDTDLKSVSDKDLEVMILAITPAAGVFAFGVLQ